MMGGFSSSLRFLCASFLALALLLGAATEASARSASALERQLGPGVEVQKDRETGNVGFVGTAPGVAIPTDAGGPLASAREFVDSLDGELGLAEPGVGLEPAGRERGPSGRRTIRLQQTYRGVPVVGGELAVNLDRSGDVVSLSGETEPRFDLDATPGVAEQEADDVAIAVTARAHQLGTDDLLANQGELSIYDSRLLGGPGPEVPLLVWRFEVTSPEDATVRELVLVDAQRGISVLNFNQTPEALNRVVCDAANTSTRYPCQVPYTRAEGQGPSGIADADAAYEFTGDAYDFFFDRFGRDSLDGNGLQLVSTVRYCEVGDCPYLNAFWDGEQMVYGEGLAVDDVVGHELSHGFTQFSSNLFYYYQAGAINESLSDVFGELIDLTNDAGSDAPSDRWKLGEDGPAAFGGICAGPGNELRNMADPTLCGQPDSTTSELYFGGEGDNGGVHTNSGVNNKATFLMVDGGSFGGQNVTGIGIDKASRVYYDAANTLLTSGSDYRDLHNALNQACSNLVGSEGFTAGDCAQVQAATEAVRMNIVPPSAPTNEAETCEVGGESVADVFFDDLENPDSGNWVSRARVGDDAWEYPQPDFFTYATSGETNFWGYDQPGTGTSGHDYAIEQTADSELPVGAYLRFDHAYSFEQDEDGTYDGGVVEYSTDGGASWTDAGALLDSGGAYDGTIGTGFGNPLAGRGAFTGPSNGYGASRADLASLAGGGFRTRFRIGVDDFALSDDLGWFIDDVRIYACVPDTAITGGPTAGAVIADAAPTFPITNSSAAGSGFELSVDGAPFAAVASGASGITLPPLADGTHTVAIRALGSRGTADPSPAETSFTVDTIVSDADATARKKQKQKGKRIKVKIKVGAQEAVTVEGSGKIKVGKRNYKLKPKSKSLGAGQAKVLRLKPVRKKHGKKIANALAKGKKVRAPIAAEFTDAVGNSVTEKRVVRLKGKLKKGKRRG